MEYKRIPGKATVYCLSRPDSQELSHKDLLPEIEKVLKEFCAFVSFERGLANRNENGKDFVFIFCEGMNGTAEEGDLKSLMDAIQLRCSKTFEQCTVNVDRNSTSQGNVLLVLKMTGIDHVEIFSSFPNYQFTLV